MYLFELMAKQINFPLHGEKETDPEKINRGDYYKNEWLFMDYNSIYGGYIIMIVLRGTGQSYFDSSSRKSSKEMISYLRGVLKGLALKNGNIRERIN